MRQQRLTILGIDPGSRVTGYGVIWVQGQRQGVIDFGCIRTSGDQLAERLWQIQEKLCELIVSHQPNCASIEQIFIKNNPQAALKLGQARGAALAVLGQHRLAVAEYAPRQIKQACVGYGNAEKGQIQHMIKKLFNIQQAVAADAADALAIALCHANHVF